MDNKQKALLFGAIRLGVGTGLVIAPGFAGRVWVGPDADGPGAKVFARAIGARDALLGLRTLQAVRSESESAHLLATGVAADAADVAATLVAWRNLTPVRRALMPVIAGAVGVIGYLAGREAAER